MVDTRQFATEGRKELLGQEGALQPNTVLQNRYRIEGVLGIGGMGSVYQARDLQFPEAQRFVAVKEMLHHTNDPQLREMALKNFHREANILAGLNHPAVSTIHDYFPTKDRAYLVMEFINGSDLDKIIERHEGFLPVVQVVEWFITLCDVLNYLHTNTTPIVFRDVKPSNVMIDVYGRLRLIDFGIAKHFNPEGGKGTMIGTEGYAAPENYRGIAAPESDIFGVGATMHHVLTRHDPRLDAPFTFAERPIRATNPEVPPELEAIVMKALAFSGEDRFNSASEMKGALERLITRSKGTTLIGGNVHMDSGSEQSWDTHDSSGGIEPRWKYKVEEEIRSTPVVSGNTVFVTVYDNNLYAINTENGQQRWKYPATDIIAASPAVSEADGLVFFGSKDCKLYAIDIRTKREVWPFTAQGPIYSSPIVEHGHVFFGSDDGYLYALRVSTGKLVWKYASGSPIRSKPSMAGERILFGNKSGELMALDLGGQMKWRFKARKEIISSPLVHNGLAYFGSLDGYIYAVDIETSWSAWKMQTNKPIVGSPVFGEDRIYVGSVNGFLYAFDPESGRERWKFNTNSQITSSPFYEDGAVYFGTNDNKIYCIDAKGGKERWSFETGGPIPGSPTVVDGVVYIGSTDHYLYAFKA